MISAFASAMFAADARADLDHRLVQLVLELPEQRTVPLREDLGDVRAQLRAIPGR